MKSFCTSLWKTLVSLQKDIREVISWKVGLLYCRVSILILILAERETVYHDATKFVMLIFVTGMKESMWAPLKSFPYTCRVDTIVETWKEWRNINLGKEPISNIPSILLLSTKCYFPCSHTTLKGWQHGFPANWPFVPQAVYAQGAYTSPTTLIVTKFGFVNQY